MIESSKENRRDESETIVEKVKSPRNMKRKTEVVHGDYEIELVNVDDSLHQKMIGNKKFRVNVEIKKENIEFSDINTNDNVAGVKQMFAAPDGTKKPYAHEYTNEIDQANNDESLPRKKVSKIKVIPDEEIKKEPAETCDENIPYNVEGVKQTSIAPDGARQPDTHDNANEIDQSNIGESLPQNKICKKNIIPNVEIKKENVEGDQLKTHDKNITDDFEGVGQSSTAPNGAKKVPSRSARRKKAKRKRMQEVAKISRNIAADTHEHTNKISQANNDESLTQKQISMQKIMLNEEFKKEDTETCDKNVRNNVEGVEQMSTALDGAKKVPSGSGRRTRPNRRRRLRVAKISQNPDPQEYTYEIDQANIDGPLPQKKICKKMIIPTVEIKKEPAETCGINIRNNFEGVKQTSSACAGAKKVPSRNAMRKKAKKRWRRELAKMSRNRDTDYTNEVDQANNHESLPRNKISKIKVVPNKEIKKEPAETCDINIGNRFEEVEQPSLAHAGAKKVPSRNAMRKQAKQKWRQEFANISRNFKMPAKVVHINFMEQDERNQNDSDEKQIKLPDVSFPVALRWNGTRKRKGQKWGLEKFSTFERDDLRKTTKETSSVLTVNRKNTLIHLIEFDQLPLCNSPKKGDVIAYRNLELSSSSTPELSCIRVGKISYLDAENIVLMPVPQYPIVFDKMDPDKSLYKEDGSLVIKFAALADVRMIEQSSSDAVKAVSDGVDPNPQGGEKNAASSLMSNSNDDRASLHNDPNPVVDDKDGNAWAEINKLSTAKKSELLEVNQETKKDSGGTKWSYGGSAVGPTMALLRSKNYI